MKRQFRPQGLLAFDPRAFSFWFDEPETPKPELHGSVAVVSVRGPLMHHDDSYWCDSYDAIKCRVLEAIELKPAAIVLSIDSPGGLVSGCFDTATEIKAACEAANVPLHTYIDGQATSAGYALACIGQTITIPETGVTGSIGVIDTLIDATAQDAMFGVKFTLVTSGARKADGNPSTPTTEAMIAESQRHVGELAGVFFEHVARNRSGLDIKTIDSFEAGVFIGADAVSKGLADQIGTMDQLLAMLASGAAPAAKNSNEGSNRMDDEEIIAALQAIIDGDGDDDKKDKARAALAALKGEDDGDDTEAETGDGGDEDDKKEDDKEPEGKAASATAALAERVAALEAENKKLKSTAAKNDRASIRASRPDVSAAVHDALGKLDMASYRKALAEIPKRASATKPTTTVAATRGSTQTNVGVSRLSAEKKEELDTRMGLGSEKRAVTFDGVKQTFGAVVPDSKAG